MSAIRRPRDPATVFAALGDRTRLALLSQLGAGESRSIQELTVASAITRQGVAKHLRTLEKAGLVAGERLGRERRFRLCPAPLSDATRYLQAVSLQWDHALARLKLFVEADGADAK